MFGSLRRRQAAADALVQEVFAAAGVGLCLVDADGRVVQANDAWLSAFGFSREVAAGRLLWELLTCAPRELQHKLEVARAGTPVELPQHRQVTGQRETWQEGRLAPVHLDRGVGVLFTAVDVTEKKRAADALHRSEAELRISLANAAIGFARATPEGRILDVNLAYSTITGFTMEELHRKQLLDVVHPDDRPAGARQIERMLAGEITDFVMESRNVRKDGGLVWVRKSVSLVRSPGGAPQWIIALVEDVTERRRAEEALRASEQKISAICDHAPFAIALAQLPTRRIVKVNQAFIRLFEVPREQALGKTSAELGLLGEGEQARVSEELERLGRVDALEVERTTRSGERRVVSLSLEPLTIGGEAFVVTMAQDVTGRGPGGDVSGRAAPP